MTYHAMIAPGCPFRDTAITNSDTDAQWQWFLLHALERRRVVLDSLVEAARSARRSFTAEVGAYIFTFLTPAK